MKRQKPSPSTRIERDDNGEVRVVVVCHPFIAYLDPIDAETLLYSLHTDVNTLRGIRKKPTLRARITKAHTALRRG